MEYFWWGFKKTRYNNTIYLPNWEIYTLVITMINLTVKEVFLTLLIILHIPSPYQARTKSVSSPYELASIEYGDDTE